MKHLELLQSQTSTMFADCIIGAGEVKIGENHHLIMATKIESFLGLPTGTVDNHEGHMFFLVQSLESGEKKPVAIDELNPEHLKLVIDAYDPEHYKATPDVDAVNRSLQHECPFDAVEGDGEGFDKSSGDFRVAMSKFAAGWDAEPFTAGHDIPKTIDDREDVEGEGFDKPLYLSAWGGTQFAYGKVDDQVSVDTVQHECLFDVIEGDTEIMRETEDEKHLAFINHTLALGGIH